MNRTPLAVCKVCPQSSGDGLLFACSVQAVVWTGYYYKDAGSPSWRSIFDEGPTGSGLNIEGLMEIPIRDNIKVDLRFGYSSLYGESKSNEISCFLAKADTSSILPI